MGSLQTSTTSGKSKSPTKNISNVLEDEPLMQCHKQVSPLTSDAPSLGNTGLAPTGARRTKEYEATPRGRATKLLRGAIRRSKKSERVVTITTDWILDRLEQGACEATGLPFCLDSNSFDYTAPLSPSLDRIDNSLDYTPENTQVVVWIFNRAKGDWGKGALQALANALVEVHGESNV